MTEDDRSEYVLELAITGVAVVHVVAVSDEDAREKAIARVRPADVTEVDECSVRRGVRLGDKVGGTVIADVVGGAQTAPTGPA